MPGILFPIDLFSGALWFLVLTLIAILWRNRKYRDTIIARYYLPALQLRFLGAVLSACMYHFYYGGGDTMTYYKVGKGMYGAFTIDPLMWMEMVFSSLDYYSVETRAYMFDLAYGGTEINMHKGASGFVGSTAGFFSIFTFNSYLANSFIITSFAFLGNWKIYKVFYSLYPKLHKQLAFAILFVPSVFFWGTGVMKDPIVLGALGFLFYYTYRFAILKIRSPLYLLFIVLSAAIVIIVKAYILFAFLPALLIWIFLILKKRIQNRSVKILATPLLLMLAAGAGVFLLSYLGSYSQKYALENVADTASITANYIQGRTEAKGGTGYTLGEVDNSIAGLLVKFPQAVNVTLYRPYPWEAGKVINLPAVAESFAALLLTLFLFYKIGLFRFFRIVFNNEEIIFCLLFSIIFAFAVGISTYNFGALARYKIPCLPFFYTALVLIWNQYRIANERLLTISTKDISR